MIKYLKSLLQKRSKHKLFKSVNIMPSGVVLAYPHHGGVYIYKDLNEYALAKRRVLKDE